MALRYIPGRCQHYEDGIRCPEISEVGSNFCPVHRVCSLVPANKAVYGYTIWQTLESLKADNTFDSMDAEIAYLKMLPDQIDSEPELRRKPIEKYKLLLGTLNSIIANLEKRREYIAKKKYMLDVEMMKSLMGQLFIILRRYVPDENTLRMIGIEFNRINIDAFRKSNEL